MKKLVGIGLAAAISLGALSGCSLLGESERFCTVRLRRTSSANYR